ncbi:MULTISPECIES: hypothetical protein [unclassified Caballeronia]|jgi:hypothetical protein|uniref:hypothetical protein n=1 Tax=unclassified Caballeronia TaxID=2646786 RepID=UPI00202995B7|nr:MULTISPECIES: hypothetical protein [unclassified Caballeronia]
MNIGRHSAKVVMLERRAQPAIDRQGERNISESEVLAGEERGSQQISVANQIRALARLTRLVLLLYPRPIRLSITVNAKKPGTIGAGQAIGFAGGGGVGKANRPSVASDSGRSY